MAKTKIRYGIDPFNRLKQFRYIIDGQFKIGKNNSLLYAVKSPQPPSIPQQLKLSGNWSLDTNHDLVLTLNKENNQLSGDKITLQGEIIRAESGKLEFLISSKDIHGQNHLYIIALFGAWQADKYNRLKFLVQKKKENPDELTLSGNWEINRQNQIIYTYTKTGLKTREKLRHTLAFKGFWDITGKQRIFYCLNKETGSGFDFNVSIGEPLKKGLRYELGIGVSPRKKKITLSGSWKINKKLGILFEMPYTEGKVRAISFGAAYKLNKDKELELTLKDSLNKDLGIKLRLSKSFPGDQGEVFIQALKQGKEISFQAGVGFRW